MCVVGELGRRGRAADGGGAAVADLEAENEELRRELIELKVAQGRAQLSLAELRAGRREVERDRDEIRGVKRDLSEARA